MSLKTLGEHWERFAKTDPRWAILTDPTKRDGKWTDEEFFQTGRVDVENVCRMLGRLALWETLPKHRALDFGCGEGRLTQALACHFKEVDGVDISPTMLRRADIYNCAPERVRYHLNARPDLARWGDDSFDFVYSFVTLHHIRPQYQRAYLKEFLRLTKPTGLVVFHLTTDLRVGRFKELVKHIVPSLSMLYQQVRGLPAAVMEVNPVPEARVRSFLNQVGGQVLHTENCVNSTDMPGLYYVVRKRIVMNET